MSKKPNRAVQYKIANGKFLEEKSKEDGIIALESGILMRRLEKGNGTVFDTTDGQALSSWSTLCFGIELLKIQ